MVMFTLKSVDPFVCYDSVMLLCGSVQTKFCPLALNLGVFPMIVHP